MAHDRARPVTVKNLMARFEPILPQPGPVLLGGVFDIQRFSLHDGPGIRTTVFLKGCPLRCLWCHNPEGISPGHAVSFVIEKCQACGECVRTCPNGAHQFVVAETQVSELAHVYNRMVCAACGQCTETCDTGALEYVGRFMTVDAVMKEVAQDREFYATSGGGLTISGGEPLAQMDFTVALLRTAREEEIHRCVETSGFASWERLRILLPLVNLFLFDWKETDEQRHAEFTGHSNQLILQNLRALHKMGAKIQLQCPIIPGFNDREEHLEGIADLAHSLINLEGVRLLPYHPLGGSKLNRFGFKPPVSLPPEPLPQSVLDQWVSWLSDQGVRVLNGADPPASPSTP